MKKLILALTGAALMFACAEKKEQKAESEEVKSPSQNVELANSKDPICGMSVKGHYEDTAMYKGKVYGFCNTACKEEFKKNPEEYLKE